MTPLEVRIVRKGDPAPFPELEGRLAFDGLATHCVITEGGTSGGGAAVTLFATDAHGGVHSLVLTEGLFDMAYHALKGAKQHWLEFPR